MLLLVDVWRMDVDVRSWPCAASAYRPKIRREIPLRKLEDVHLPPLAGRVLNQGDRTALRCQRGTLLKPQAQCVRCLVGVGNTSMLRHQVSCRGKSANRGQREG